LAKFLVEKCNASWLSFHGSEEEDLSLNILWQADPDWSVRYLQFLNDGAASLEKMYGARELGSAIRAAETTRELSLSKKPAKVSVSDLLWIDLRPKEWQGSQAAPSSDATAAASTGGDHRHAAGMAAADVTAAALAARVQTLREFWEMRGPGVAWFWSQLFSDLRQFDVRLYGVLPQLGGGGGWCGADNCWVEALLHDVDDQLPEVARVLWFVAGAGWWQWALAQSAGNRPKVRMQSLEQPFAPPWPGFIEQTVTLALVLAHQVDWIASPASVLPRVLTLWLGCETTPASGSLDSETAVPQSLLASPRWQPFAKWLSLDVPIDPNLLLAATPLG
jgi:hypothetical protein